MAGGSTSKRKSQRRPRSRRDRKPNPTAQLTDDLLLEIIARVPYRSLRHCLCVCQRWCALISHPDNRARLPHTVTGFFYPLPFDDDDSPALTPPAWTPHGFGFLNVSGTGAPFIDLSFSFLPDREGERLELVDCCNGLLLCRCYGFADEDEFDYLVLNPASEKWVTVPVMRCWSDKLETVRLGFDPAVSPHFYVFEFQSDFDNDGSRDGHVLGVKIYSSAT